MKNDRHSRRDFISLTGAGIAGVVGGTWPRAAASAETQSAALTPQDVDLVVFNAKVYTVDARAPKAEAFAVKGGRFLAVGSTKEIRTLIGKGTQTMDAGQMTVVPGFIDCHNHAPGNVLLYEVLVEEIPVDPGARRCLAGLRAEFLDDARDGHELDH